MVAIFRITAYGVAVAYVSGLLSLAHAGIAKPEPGKGIAVVENRDRLISIDSVDGQSVNHRPAVVRFLVPNPKRELRLTPGVHTLQVAWRGRSAYSFRIILQPGHTYQIEDDQEREPRLRVVGHSLARELAKVWVVDSQSQERVGELLESWNEPVEGGETIRLSDFFVWSVPAIGDQMTLFRSTDSLTLSWPGENADLFFIEIRIFPLPALNTEDEFIAFIRDHQSRPTPKANTAGKEMSESLEAYQGRGDFCVKYERSLLKKAPGLLVGTSPIGLLVEDLLAHAFPSRVLVQRYGYSCRIPTKKRYGIDFQYSHLSSEEHKEHAMAGWGDQYFDVLKF